MSSNWTLPSTSAAAAGVTAKTVQNATEMAKNNAELDKSMGNASIECTLTQGTATYNMMQHQADAKRDGGIGEFVGAVGQVAAEGVGYRLNDVALGKDDRYTAAQNKLNSLENCEKMLSGKDIPHAEFDVHVRDANQDPGAIEMRALNRDERSLEEHLECVSNWHPNGDGPKEDVAKSLKFLRNENPRKGSPEAAKFQEARELIDKHAKTISDAKKAVNTEISNIKSGYTQRGERVKNVVASSRGIAVGGAQQAAAVEEKDAAEEKKNEVFAELAKNTVQRGQKTAEEAQRSALELMRMATDIQGEVRRHQAG